MKLKISSPFLRRKDGDCLHRAVVLAPVIFHAQLYIAHTGNLFPVFFCILNDIWRADFGTYTAAFVCPYAEFCIYYKLYFRHEHPLALEFGKDFVDLGIDLYGLLRAHLLTAVAFYADFKIHHFHNMFLLIDLYGINMTVLNANSAANAFIFINDNAMFMNIHGAYPPHCCFFSMTMLLKSSLLS